MTVTYPGHDGYVRVGGLPGAIDIRLSADGGFAGDVDGFHALAHL